MLAFRLNLVQRYALNAFLHVHMPYFKAIGLHVPSFMSLFCKCAKKEEKQKRRNLISSSTSLYLRNGWDNFLKINFSSYLYSQSLIVPLHVLHRKFGLNRGLKATE